MRGFKYNARNGGSVALINTELRVPFLRYLSKRKLKSSFLRHLQVVGFLDVGTAWHGRDPFSDENPLNTLTLTNPPTVTVDVKYFRNPIIAGYGAGVRTLLFGYFLKLDYAWGWETRQLRNPVIHFSMGTDF
ncbi:MAG: BamA/TamA family outer membrane protein [Saprospiraceae bacterium]|nr:BamA/TamA family outer membrane protein [Saprospiraceae bacterium]